jgi:branched-subunit amino acid transport protein
LLWVAILSGLGTFLIRYLPMHWHEKGEGGNWMRGSLRRSLDAIGPAAIVALIVVSCWSLLGAGSYAREGLPLVLGLAGVALGKKYLGSIAWATLAGVLAYGFCVWGIARFLN